MQFQTSAYSGSDRSMQFTVHFCTGSSRIAYRIAWQRSATCSATFFRCDFSGTWLHLGAS
jgi:hypothetical protein